MKDARRLHEVGSRLSANRAISMPAPVTVASGGTGGAPGSSGAGQRHEQAYRGGSRQLAPGPVRVGESAGGAAQQAEANGAGPNGFGIGPTLTKQAKRGQMQRADGAGHSPEAKYGEGPKGIGKTGTGAPWG